MNKCIYTAVIGILVFLVAITIFIYINLNPQSQLQIVPFGLSYPDSPEYVSGKTNLSISMMIVYNGTLAENSPFVAVNSTCDIAFPYNNEIWTVEVGFPEAIPSNFKSHFKTGGRYIGGLGGVTFTNENKSGSLDVYAPENYFPVAGDYSPAIFITFFNGTNAYYTYNQMKLHVVAESEVEAQNADRSNLVLTFALLGFSYIEGFMIIRDLLEKRKKNQSEKNSIANTQPPTNKPQPNKTESNSNDQSNGEPLDSPPKKSNVPPNEDNSINKPIAIKD